MQEPTTPRPAEPKAGRLAFPRGYAVPKGDELIPWSWVAERLERSENYWMATTNPDGRPHVTPLWGVWVDQALYFDGIPTARWARNLKVNPAAAIHLESGTDVVILDGAVEVLVVDAGLGHRIVEAWSAKYGRLQPEPATSGIFCFRPRAARAWSRFPDDATRWSFSPRPDRT